jgi:predicted alpha/beta-fold hydrolase
MNLLNEINETSDKLWEPVLKPSRKPICNEVLGMNLIHTKTKVLFQRWDSHFRSYDNTQIEMTCYMKVEESLEELLQKKQPSNSSKQTNMINCKDKKQKFWKTAKHFMIYFHSHGSNRQEGRFLLDYAAEMGFNLCLIDMRGSGVSKGQFVTLGAREYKDIYCLLQKFKRTFETNQFFLYGRSMGAVAIMKFMYSYRNGNI